MNSETQISYRPYVVAWLVLLGITLLMLLERRPPVLIAGISLKASIIGLWFMHLREERVDLTAWIVVGLIGMALILFFLMVPDARVM